MLINRKGNICLLSFLKKEDEKFHLVFQYSYIYIYIYSEALHILRRLHIDKKWAIPREFNKNYRSCIQLMELSWYYTTYRSIYSFGCIYITITIRRVCIEVNHAFEHRYSVCNVRVF